MNFLGACLLFSAHVAIGFRVPTKRENTNSSKACVQLFAIGDFGARGSVQDKVRDSMADVAGGIGGVDGILALGDNLYPNGVGPSGRNMEDNWKDVYLGKSSLKTKWYAVTGNHDWAGDAKKMRKYKDSGGFWQMPDFFHSVKFGSSGSDVEVFLLDTEIWRGGKEKSRRTEQKDWLKRKMQESSAKWKIVVGHHPIYSGGKHGGSSSVKSDLDPIMRSNGATIYFSGHDHAQQHIQVNNVNYVVTGAGSKVSTRTSSGVPKGASKIFLKEAGFAGLSICDSETATLTFYNDGGRAKYTTTLKNDGSSGGEPSRRRGGGEPPRRRGGGGDDRRREDRRRRSRRRDSRSRNRSRNRSRSASVSVSESDEESEAISDSDSSETESEAPPEIDSSEATCAGTRMHDVDLRCDDGCTVQTNVDWTVTSCDDYCADHGLVCRGAWINEDEGCGLDTAINCDSVVDGSSNPSQVCRCAQKES